MEFFPFVNKKFLSGENIFLLKKQGEKKCSGTAQV
jgi:hypothetical protein